MGALSEQQKFLLKIVAVLLASLGGWFATISTWHSLIATPLPLGGLFAIIAAQLYAILGITSPSAARAVDIALLPGVRTREDVNQIVKATEPGSVPSREVTAAILGQPSPPPNKP